MPLRYFGLPAAPSRPGWDFVNRATTLAVAAYHGQTRKNGLTPQITHPLHVQGLLARAGVEDPVVHATALLHDALEDNPPEAAGVLAAAIQQQLGSHVLGLVQLLSDDPAMPHAQRKAEQLPKYRAAPWNARVVKLADVVASLQEGPAPQWNAGKAHSYLAQRVALLEGALRNTCATLEHEFLAALASPRWALAQWDSAPSAARLRSAAA